MFSLGGLFVLWLIDVVLIALQLLQPADGSHYIMNYYGPRVSALRYAPLSLFLRKCHLIGLSCSFQVRRRYELLRVHMY